MHISNLNRCFEEFNLEFKPLFNYDSLFIFFQDAGSNLKYIKPKISFKNSPNEFVLS